MLWRECGLTNEDLIRQTDIQNLRALQISWDQRCLWTVTKTNKAMVNFKKVCMLKKTFCKTGTWYAGAYKNKALNCFRQWSNIQVHCNLHHSPLVELTLCSGWGKLYPAYQSNVYWSPVATTPRPLFWLVVWWQSCFRRSPHRTQWWGLNQPINQEIHYWPLSFDGTQLLLQGFRWQKHGLLINWLV